MTMENEISRRLASYVIANHEGESYVEIPLEKINLPDWAGGLFLSWRDFSEDVKGLAIRRTRGGAIRALRYADTEKRKRETKMLRRMLGSKVDAKRIAAEVVGKLEKASRVYLTVNDREETEVLLSLEEMKSVVKPDCIFRLFYDGEELQREEVLCGGKATVFLTQSEEDILKGHGYVLNKIFSEPFGISTCNFYYEDLLQRVILSKCETNAWCDELPRYFGHVVWECQTTLDEAWDKILEGIPEDDAPKEFDSLNFEFCEESDRIAAVAMAHWQAFPDYDGWDSCINGEMGFSLKLPSPVSSSQLNAVKKSVFCLLTTKVMADIKPL